MTEKLHASETGKHLDAFIRFYEANRDLRKVAQDLAVSKETIRNWVKWYGWNERADRMDQVVRAAADKQAVDRRIKKMEEQRVLGETMRLRAMEHFSVTVITCTRDAIAAARIGIEIEREAEGWSTSTVMVQGDADNPLMTSVLTGDLKADMNRLQTLIAMKEALKLAVEEANEEEDGDELEGGENK